jgi:lactate 2-monooxygenase
LPVRLKGQLIGDRLASFECDPGPFDSDVVKALAMGARAVGVGRPYAYGLALDGAAGAPHVLKCLLAEADLLMAVNGYPTVPEVRAAGVIRV